MRLPPMVLMYESAFLAMPWPAHSNAAGLCQLTAGQQGRSQVSGHQDRQGVAFRMSRVSRSESRGWRMQCFSNSLQLAHARWRGSHSWHMFLTSQIHTNRTLCIATGLTQIDLNGVAGGMTSVDELLDDLLSSGDEVSKGRAMQVSDGYVHGSDHLSQHASMCTCRTPMRLGSRLSERTREVSSSGQADR